MEYNDIYFFLHIEEITPLNNIGQDTDFPQFDDNYNEFFYYNYHLLLN